jgi:hypothetical protein
MRRQLLSSPVLASLENKLRPGHSLLKCNSNSSNELLTTKHEEEEGTEIVDLENYIIKYPGTNKTVGNLSSRGSAREGTQTKTNN